MPAKYITEEGIKKMQVPARNMLRLGQGYQFQSNLRLSDLKWLAGKLNRVAGHVRQEGPETESVPEALNDLRRGGQDKDPHP